MTDYKIIAPPVLYPVRRAGPIRVSAQIPVDLLSFPTSYFGATIPLVYGLLPKISGSYIWAAPVNVESVQYQELQNNIVKTNTVTTVTTTFRVRFGKPLVADSRWTLKKIWFDNVKVYDQDTGTRASGLNFRAYDGYSGQGIDPTQAGYEGAANLSAHRGYLDLVVTNWRLASVDGQPPLVEAEWVQNFEDEVTSATINKLIDSHYGTPAIDFENGLMYTFNGDAQVIRTIDISARQEILATTYWNLNTGNLLTFSDSVRSLRWVSSINRVFAMHGQTPMLADPESGAVFFSAGVNMGSSSQYSAVIANFANHAVALVMTAGSSFRLYRLERDAISSASDTITDYSTTSRLQPTATLGELTGTQATFWLGAAENIVKVVVDSNGAIISRDIVYVLPGSPPATAVADFMEYFDGDVFFNDDDNKIHRYDPASDQILWSTQLPNRLPLWQAGANRIGSDSLVVYVQANGNYRIDLSTGNATAIGGVTFVNPVFGAFDNVDQYYFVSGSSLIYYTSSRSGEDAFTAGGFIEALAEYMGYDDAEIDASAITDSIVGGVIANAVEGRALLAEISRAYSASFYESGGVVKFDYPPTDGSFVADAAIASTDFADVSREPIQIKRFNPQELAGGVSIYYVEQDQNYQVMPADAKLPTVPFQIAASEIIEGLGVPFIIDKGDARTLAFKRLARIDAEREEYSFGVRRKHILIEPGDVAQFTVSGRLTNALVYRADTLSDGSQNIICRFFTDRVAAAIAGDVGTIRPGAVMGRGISTLYHLDVPLLDSGDDLRGDGLRQYWVVTSKGQEGWPGGTLYRRDTIYEPIGFNNVAGLVGIAQEALGDCDNPDVTEFTRTLEVAMIVGDTDDPETVTYQEMIEGANRVAIGAPGRWEICHFQTVTDNDDGTVTLETFVRDRGGLRENTGNHVLGDYVVWLPADFAQSTEYEIAQLDASFLFKAVGVGESFPGVPAVERTITGEAEKIPPPSYVKATKDGTDLDITWVRSSRTGIAWPNDGGWEAPLDVTHDSDTLVCLDEPGGTATLTITDIDPEDETYTLSSAQQTTAFGGEVSAGDIVTITLRAVSTVGVTCPAREFTITVE